MNGEEFGVVILGGGMTGLSAAYRLEQEGVDYCLFESEERVGGLCRSEKADGFTFDYAGHLLHFLNAETEKFVKEVVEEVLVAHNRRAWVYSNGAYTRYPFQRNLHGLPDSIIKECVLAYVEADIDRGKEHKGDFQSWAISTFGDGIARHFMIPYNRKMWVTEPDRLTCDWMGRFVPDTNPVDIISGAFSPSTEEVGYNVQFFYPQKGGIEVVVNSIASKLTRLTCKKKVVKIDLETKYVDFEDGSSCSYKGLISTIPLPELTSCLSAAPRSMKGSCARLIHTSVLDVNIGFSVADLTDKHWVYVPEPEIPFYRIGFPHNFSPLLVPQGKTSAYAEISYRGSHRWNEETLVSLVLSGMNKMGFAVSESDVEVVKIMDIKYAYVIYDSNREKSLEAINEYLEANGIRTAGRFGAWSYLSMEDSIRDGIKAAESFIH
ncbi:FAD-binding protein [candidate division TA06 bacterium]|uniref:FAD-binding protein n=1 Tax=candidate division TA06 bacterium TaxID=2250710 RepID=A0A523UN06_UNCT6|nr:MAG: FAD-binding protein [candidate division TA06 bacterium]